MAYYGKRVVTHLPVSEVTNAQAKVLLSRHDPFQAPPKIKYSNLAYAA